MKHFWIFLLFIVHYSLFIESQATIRYVRPASYGSGNGSSWMDASNDLQRMINLSAAGDSIFVAQGTYIPRYTADGYNAATNTYPYTDGGRDNSFVLKADMKIFGGFPNNGTATWAQRNWNAYPSILSGDRGIVNDMSDNCCHVVISEGEIGDACLDGFTITKGNADSGSYYLGIFVNEFMVERIYGGGIIHEGGILSSSSLKLINLIIDSNRAMLGSGIYNNYFNLSSSLILTNVIMNGNYTISQQTTGQIHNTHSSSILTNVIIIGNNIANESAICNFYSSSVLTNVLIVKTQYYGSTSTCGIWNSNSSLTLTNVTISDNSIGIYNYASSLVIRNSIIWGNRFRYIDTTINANIINNEDYPSTIYYQNCLIGEEPIGNGIILNCDPLFIDTAKGNYRLAYCSPAIDTGNNAFYSSDSLPDLSTVTTDVDGKLRIFNGIVDLGAYESKSLSVTFHGDTTYQREKTVCYGDTVSIAFDLSGIAPWQLIYTKDKGISYDTIKDIRDSLFYWQIVAFDTTNYKFLAIGDNHCVHTLRDSIQINVPKLIFTNSFFNDTLCSAEQTKAVAFTGDANLHQWIASGDRIENIPTGIQTGNFGKYIVENKGNTPLTSRITVTPKYIANGKTCTGTDTSFSITVYPAPVLTSLLQNDTLCDGEQTKAVAFEGTGFFEWTTAGNVPNIPASGTGNFGNYTVTNKSANPLKSTVTVMPKYTEEGKECAGEGQTFEIVVNPTTTIYSFLPNIDSVMLCGQEEDVKMEVNAFGKDLVYQWYHNGIALTGEQSEQYTPSSVEGNSGQYYVEVSGVCGNAKSRIVTIGGGLIKVLVSEWNEEIAAWDGIVLENNYFRKYFKYQWYKDGTMIGGATQSYYQEKSGLNGCYSVELTLADKQKIRSCERCFDKTKKYITLYPNLVKRGDVVTVLFNPPCEYINFLTIEVFAATGQQVFRMQTNNKTVEIETINLSAGVYILKIYTEDQWVYVEKMIVY